MAAKKVTPGALLIRGSEEWKAWLDELAGHLQTNQSGVIARAVAELAQRHKFRPPPERLRPKPRGS